MPGPTPDHTGSVRRVAVVGSGVAGLTAAHVASRAGNGTHVTLLEADIRLGGHADTHRITDPTGRELHIDSGFIVHNRRTYPTLLRLFDELGVATQESEMSMSTADEGTGLEWAGALGRRGVFPRGAGHHRNPDYLRMLVEIPRFHRRAHRLLTRSDDPAADPTTLATFLDEGRFSPYFRRHFMEPLVAAVWSCEPGTALDYPAAYLFAFLQHHGMLRVFGSPTWRTVVGGSRSYVDAVAQSLREAGATIRCGEPVVAIEEGDDHVSVTTTAGREEYDAVVVAAHPEQALAMLARPTAVQREVLGALPYSSNTALLHTDTSLMPQHRDTWASWNFRRPDSEQGAERAGVLVTYDMTRLQRLPTDTTYLVTLGGEDLVDPDTVLVRREYAHPLYTPGSVAAQRRLPEVDTDRVVFAGAYHGWGFHEDGARSGRAAAERLGLRWDPPSPLIPRTPTTGGPEAGVRGPATARAVGRHRAEPGRKRPAPPAAVAGAAAGRRGADASGRHEAPAATPYVTTLTHHRREPIDNRFTHRSRFWVVDLDRVEADGRVPGGRGRFVGRDHFDGDTTTVREGLDRFLARHGLDLRGGTALMAAHPRAFGHCFNPISVHWCWTEQRSSGGRPAGPPDVTVVEVHNTYGDRHAYLVDADADGRAVIDKALYVSPFHGTDGHYEVRVPPPSPGDGTLGIGIRLVTDDGARFDAALAGHPASSPGIPLAGLRGAALIRVHGIALWLRRLPVQPRPRHAPAATAPVTTDDLTGSHPAQALPPTTRSYR